LYCFSTALVRCAVTHKCLGISRFFRHLASKPPPHSVSRWPSWEAYQSTQRGTCADPTTGLDVVDGSGSVLILSKFLADGSSIVLIRRSASSRVTSLPENG
jgi:hypothetical protein